MTFTVNIFTYQVITEQNFDLKLEHVSKYGKLFCIFPIGDSEIPNQDKEKRNLLSEKLSKRCVTGSI